mmetsp:Transcript_17257/g.18948  ORF Transcript_17257/g.18948 Transcript_17257/m.18948 type:complete len:103 (+) Transcript_17257:56-364(+)
MHSTIESKLLWSLLWSRRQAKVVWLSIATGLFPFIHTVFGEFICRCYCIDTTGTVTIVAVSSVPPAIPSKVSAVTAAAAAATTISAIYVTTVLSLSLSLVPL